MRIITYSCLINYNNYALSMSNGKSKLSISLLGRLLISFNQTHFLECKVLSMVKYMINAGIFAPNNFSINFIIFINFTIDNTC